MTWNVGAAKDAGVDVPTDAVVAAGRLQGDRRRRQVVHRAGRSVPPNPGLMAMSISATRVYADDPGLERAARRRRRHLRRLRGLAGHPADDRRHERGGLLPEGLRRAPASTPSPRASAGAPRWARSCPGGAATEIMSARPGPGAPGPGVPAGRRRHAVPAGQPQLRAGHQRGGRRRHQEGGRGLPRVGRRAGERGGVRQGLRRRGDHRPRREPRPRSTSR